MTAKTVKPFHNQNEFITFHVSLVDDYLPLMSGDDLKVALVLLRLNPNLPPEIGELASRAGLTQEATVEALKRLEGVGLA